MSLSGTTREIHNRAKLQSRWALNLKDFTPTFILKREKHSAVLFLLVWAWSLVGILTIHSAISKLRSPFGRNKIAFVGKFVMYKLD